MCIFKLSRLWVVTIVFYTCILIPLMQLKKALASMVLFSCETKGMAKEMEFPEIPSLPVARYEDLKGHNCDGKEKMRLEPLAGVLACLLAPEHAHINPWLFT